MAGLSHVMGPVTYVRLPCNADVTHRRRLGGFRGYRGARVRPSGQLGYSRPSELRPGLQGRAGDALRSRDFSDKLAAWRLDRAVIGR
jgi:hypothetical protein